MEYDHYEAPKFYLQKAFTPHGPRLLRPEFLFRILQDFGICKFLSFLRSNSNINFSVYHNSHFNDLPQFICEIKRPEEILGVYPKIYGTSYGTSRLNLDQKYMSYTRHSGIRSEYNCKGINQIKNLNPLYWIYYQLPIASSYFQPISSSENEGRRGAFNSFIPLRVFCSDQ